MMITDGSLSDEGDVLPLEEFSPEFHQFIQKEALKVSRDHWSWRTSWVFWSQRDQESELTFPLDDYRDGIRQAFRNLIPKLGLHRYLVQFWAPATTTEGRTLLTTRFQPFSICKHNHPFDNRDMSKCLCEYRMGMCREYPYFYADAEGTEEQLGLPGRVFLHRRLESTPHVKFYTLKEYPQRELGLRCHITESWAVPILDNSSHTCIGVLEIVFSEPRGVGSVLYWVDSTFEEFGLQRADKHCEMQIRDENEARRSALLELQTVLDMVCKIHELPLAMTWVSCSVCNDLLRAELGVSMELSVAVGRSEVANFGLSSLFHHLRKGGFAGMVLSPPYMLYCSDITNFSISEYPLVHYARSCKFRGGFMVCLKSDYTANHIYVLEFFLPRGYGYHENSWTLLSMLLGTMEENFKTFKLASGKKLGELYSFEVMDFQNGQKLRSIQKIQAKDGGAMLQLGQLNQPPMDAINNGADVVSEAQNQNLPSFQPLQSGKVKTQLDSYDQPSMDPSSNGQNVVTAERNSHVVSSSKDHKRKIGVREYQNIGVPIEVPLDDILKCSSMSRDAAAKQLNVSISTFKRVCRKYGINRWSRRDTKKVQPSPAENRGQTSQIDSYLPPNEGSGSVFNNATVFQDADMVTVWAKFRDNNKIKIRLSLSSKLVELQQEIAERLLLTAGTYLIKYKDVEDKEDGWTLIACDKDLQGCMQTSRSAGCSSVVVLLELNETLANLTSGLSGGQQTLFSPVRSQGLQNEEGKPSIVPIIHSRGGGWLDAHFSYKPTEEEDEIINKRIMDSPNWQDFCDGGLISNHTVLDYSKMLDDCLLHCRFFAPDFKEFNRWTLLDDVSLKTEKIFFPVLRNKHWMLLVIDVNKERFLWLDSLRAKRGEVEKEYAEDFAKDLNEKFVVKRLGRKRWTIEYPEDTPMQDNETDCGVYMMVCMISLAVGDKLPQINQEQGNRMRRIICLELKKWEIIPECPLADYRFLHVQQRKKKMCRE